VAVAAPTAAAPFATVTDAYERTRFGGVVLGEQEMATAESSLTALAELPRR
jgi:hypothetical protein